MKKRRYKKKLNISLFLFSFLTTWLFIEREKSPFYEFSNKQKCKFSYPINLFLEFDFIFFMSIVFDKRINSLFSYQKRERKRKRKRNIDRPRDFWDTTNKKKQKKTQIYCNEKEMWEEPQTSQRRSFTQTLVSVTSDTHEKQKNRIIMKKKLAF